jgi:predicted nucleic acid-binding protein
VSYLLDTNVLSELRKTRRDERVATWVLGVEPDELYVSVLVLGEIEKGIELVAPRDRDRARALQGWLARLEVAFRGRTVPVDRDIAHEWGRMSAVRPIPVIDGLLAASAKVRDLTLVTRNTKQLAGLGARLLDPFRA